MLLSLSRVPKRRTTLGEECLHTLLMNEVKSQVVVDTVPLISSPLIKEANIVVS